MLRRLLLLRGNGTSEASFPRPNLGEGDDCAGSGTALPHHGCRQGALEGEGALRILLLGATGFIGSAVAARLAQQGHEVIGVARTVDAAARRLPVTRWISLDLRRAGRAEDWLPHLEGIGAVVNCAGALQDSARDSR